ncbi:hypothetical protein [Aquimonas voraii]|uniref:Hemin transport protein n=1 Tax=Aquimonas voraii TaxID=265719 RepID=A0A1G6UQ66_9GAMM|nr:hypothetical protein [Aquimonas voraii]SDD43439.1 hypothetical protein SAMN04488509_102440 [Aquimonas voraii]
MFELDADTALANEERALVAASAGRRLSASTLIALGPVVCLFRREDEARLILDPAPLLAQARAKLICEVDPEGPREALRLEDREGQPILQLCLLPDSDFLVWERLLLGLSAAPMPDEALCWPSWRVRLRWRARTGRFLDTRGSLRFQPCSAPMSASGQRIAEAWCARYHCGACLR